VGERVQPLPFEDRSFVLLLPPVSVDTGAVYRQWDHRRTQSGQGDDGPGVNDLEAAAIEVAPTLARWRDQLALASGQQPRLAGSGSSWFVEGDRDDLGIAGRDFLLVDDERASLVPVRTVPAHDGPGERDPSMDGV
jgi:4-diphosphocytidyl-2-C-methyl-D-erythritol kinase